MTDDSAEMMLPEGGGVTSCGFVALIGAPNAGKSTLLNQLVGSKIAIVTHKVQTTRARIRAIALEGAAQIIFVDTPGIFLPKRKLDEEMVHAAWAGAADADVTVLLIGARDGLNDDNVRIIEGLEATGAKAILAINKIDLVPHENLLQLAADLNARYPFTDTYMISALKGHGVADLRTALANRMPKGPWLYPEDQIADVPMRVLASEITREKLYLRLHDELPYASTVETETMDREKRRVGSHRAGDLRRTRQPEEDRTGQERSDDQENRPGGSRGDYRNHRSDSASFPVRESARKVG